MKAAHFATLVRLHGTTRTETIARAHGKVPARRSMPAKEQKKSPPKEGGGFRVNGGFILHLVSQDVRVIVDL